MMRAGVYVDGYNLYYGGRASCGRSMAGRVFLFPQPESPLTSGTFTSRPQGAVSASSLLRPRAPRRTGLRLTGVRNCRIRWPGRLACSTRLASEMTWLALSCLAGRTAFGALSGATTGFPLSGRRCRRMLKHGLLNCGLALPGPRSRGSWRVTGRAPSGAGGGPGGSGGLPSRRGT